MGAPKRRRLPLSHSRIQAAACLLHFKAVVIDKVPIVKTRALMFGGFFHHFAELFTHRIEQAGGHLLEPGADAAALFATAWSERDAEHQGLTEADRAELLELCRGWARTQSIGPGFVGAERRMAVNEALDPVAWKAPDVFYRGIADRMDVDGGTLIIRDYKSSWAADTQEEAERSPQLPSYALLAHSIAPDITRFRVVLDFVRVGIERTVEFGVESLDAIKAAIFRESDRVERARAANRWPPTPCRLCAYCPVRASCPVGEAVIPLVPPATAAEREALLAAYLVRKAQIKDFDDRLRVSVREHGPIRSGDVLAQFTTEERRSYTVADLEAVCHELNLDTNDFLRVDGKSVTRQSKRSDDFAAWASEHAIVNRYSKWSVGEEADGGEL